jgi:hypothetical protein
MSDGSVAIELKPAYICSLWASRELTSLRDRLGATRVDSILSNAAMLASAFFAWRPLE